MKQPQEGKKKTFVNWKGAHITQNELVEDVQSVYVMCLYGEFLTDV